MNTEGERVEVERPSSPTRATGRRIHKYDALRLTRMRAFLTLHDQGFTVGDIALIFRWTQCAVANELAAMLAMRKQVRGADA